MFMFQSILGRMFDPLDFAVSKERYKNGSSSNGSTKAVAQRVCEKMEDLPSKSEEKVKGLHDSTFRDVRDISN